MNVSLFLFVELLCLRVGTVINNSIKGFQVEFFYKFFFKKMVKFNTTI